MSPFLFKRLSDESLGSRLASGEAAAFDELYRRYVHRLAAYGSHLLGDPAAGDDVAQATLLKAYGALRAGRVPDKMRPWLFRIAHNSAIDLVVRRRELPAAELPEVPSRDAEPLAGALVTALAALPERQRRVFVLRELHGMRIAETAGELGLTATQVEQALFAARNRLAELLVFGERLDCVTVQRLAAGPLDATERRALKTHLRSCAGCRKAVPRRSRGAVWLPGPSLEWLRGLLVGGAGPAAAKVGAVVATATIAGSVPIVAPRVEREPLPHPAPVHLRETAEPVRTSVAKAAPVVFHAPAPTRSAPAPLRPIHQHVTVEHDGAREHARTATGSGDDRRGAGTAERSGHSDTASEVPAVVAPAVTADEGAGDGRSGEASAPASSPTVTVAGVETRSDVSGGSGGSGDSGSGDGRDGGSDGGGGSSGESGSGGGGDRSDPPPTTAPALAPTTTNG